MKQEEQCEQQSPGAGHKWEWGDQLEVTADVQMG